MTIRFITLIGRPITTLRPLLEHYVGLGVSTFEIFVHDSPRWTSLLPEVSRAADICPQADVRPVSGDWLTVQTEVLDGMRNHPDDWYIIADQDEFHLYPRNLTEILEEADERGIDHINGCLVDRIAGDGTLPAVDPERSLWEQYPIGAFLTFPVCRGNFRKVAAAKGHVQFTNSGHHDAVSGQPFPITEMLVEVHHFKWVGGLLDYLTARRSPESPLGPLVQREGLRFVEYFRRQGNRIALADPGLLAAGCSPHYPHWETIRKVYLFFDCARRTDLMLEQPGGARTGQTSSESGPHPA